MFLRADTVSDDRVTNAGSRRNTPGFGLGRLGEPRQSCDRLFTKNRSRNRRAKKGFETGGLEVAEAGAKLVEALKVRGRAVPLGQALRSGRVRATHEFATTLGGAVDAARRASLDDASALAYLRGDDVDAAPPSGEPGDQCLVAHGERVLGLAKVLKGGRLKNQLPRECVRRDLAF